MEQLSFKNIIVNGRKTLIDQAELSYKDIVRIAHGHVVADASPVFTVTYCYHGKHDGLCGGSVWPGSPSVRVEDGMSFTAVITNGA